MTAFEERKKIHAAQVGVNEEKVETVRLDLERVRTLGTLVDIDIHGLSMFTRRSTYEEWGVPKKDVRALRLHRGSKDLIPREYLGRLQSLSVRFRASLDRYSFILEGFRPFRWVPFTAYEDWQAEWKDLQAEWEEVKQEILDSYESLQSLLHNDFVELATEAYGALEHRNGVMTESRTDFVKRVTELALSQFPTRAQIETGLWVDYKPAMVLGAEEIEADLLAKDKLRQIREAEAFKARLDQAKVHAEQRKLWEEAEEGRKLQAMRLAAEEKLLQAMHKAELEKAKAQMAEMVSPWNELFQQLRAQMYDDAASVLASIQRNGYITGKVMVKAKNMVEMFKLLNAHGDATLEHKLEELGRALATSVRPGDSELRTLRVKEVLDGIKGATLEAAEEVRRRAEPNLWGALEV